MSSFVGSRTGVSREAGPPPLISTPVLAPSGKKRTVTPVFPSSLWALPTRTPSNAVKGISFMATSSACAVTPTDMMAMRLSILAMFFNNFLVRIIIPPYIISFH